MVLYHVKNLVQMKRTLWSDMILTITRMTDDISVSLVDPPNPSGLSALVLEMRWEPTTLSWQWPKRFSVIIFFYHLLVLQHGQDLR